MSAAAIKSDAICPGCTAKDPWYSKEITYILWDWCFDNYVAHRVDAGDTLSTMYCVEVTLGPADEDVPIVITIQCPMCNEFLAVKVVGDHGESVHTVKELDGINWELAKNSYTEE